MPAARDDGASLLAAASQRRLVDAAQGEGEAFFRTLVQHASDVITVLDEKGIVRYESPAIQPVLGYTPDELVGTEPFALIHPDDATRIGDLFDQVVSKPGSSISARFRVRHKDDSWRWLEVIGTNLLADPSVRGVVINSRDVTDRQRAEDELQQSERRHRELLAAARRQAQELTLLDEVRTALARELDLPDLFRTVVEAISRTFGYTLVSLYMLEDNVLVLQHQVGYDRVTQRIPVTDGVSGRVVRTGEAILLEDVRADAAFIGAIPGIISEVCVPLCDQGAPVGVLNLESTGDVKLTEADLHLMVALSEHVNVAIGRARLYTEARRSEARFRALVQDTGDMISVVDVRGIRTYASPAYERVLGYRPDELVGQPIELIDHADDADLVKGRFADLPRRPGAVDRFDARVRHRDGSTRWLEVIATNLLNNPDVGGIVVISRDVTERKAAEAECERRARHASLRADISGALAERETLPNMLQRCAEAIVNQLDAAFARIWTLDEDAQVLELHASAGLYTHLDGPHSRIPVGQLKIGRIAQERLPHLTNTLIDDPEVDEPEWVRREGMVSFAGYPLRVEDRLVGVLGLFARQPLSEDTLEALASTADAIAQGVERKAFEARLWHQAHHDPLTGLPNRTLFLERLREALQLPHHRRGLGGVPVLFLDLDGFKVVNDSLGHDAGDRLLVTAAQRLARNVRGEDMIARFGGDEFAVMLAPSTDPKYAAVQVAERFSAALTPPFVLDGHEAMVTASIGIVSSPEFTEPSDLLRAVDVALYRAKVAGRGSIAVFDPDRDGLALVRLDRETALRHALERGELRVAYQPIMQLATGTVVGVEALARWEHPERGLLMPGEFIPLAEETGLILPLGRWLRAEACRQVRVWQERFPMHRPLHLRVNLSTREFRQPDLVAELARSLETAGLSPKHLTLEVTESVAIGNAEEAVATMREMKELGVRLALDDFGTGYASLAALRHMPIDELKVDRSFVAGLGRLHEDTAIVRASVGFAKSLGLRVTAEGVETAEQNAHLQELRCDYGQGYLFTPALAAAELELFLWERMGPEDHLSSGRDGT